MEEKRISPLSTVGIVLGLAYLLTREPVVAVIKAAFGLTLAMVRPVVCILGAVKVWELVQRKPAAEGGAEADALPPSEEEV